MFKKYQDNDYKYLDFRDKYRCKDKDLRSYCNDILDFYKEEILKEKEKNDIIDKEINRMKNIKNGVPVNKPMSKKESTLLEIDELISALESITVDDLSIDIISKLKEKFNDLKED